MNATRKKWLGLTGLQLLLIAFFLVAVILPLGRMLINMTPDMLMSIVSSGRFTMALVNSLTISVTATLISVCMAMLLSWCIVRTGIKMKSGWILLFTIPMLIPSISHGMGLLVLFGSNGVLTRFFQLGFDIYGFWGVVVGSVMYSFPVAFLMISDVLKYEDSSPYEAASVLGISKARQLSAVTLPYLRKPLISVCFTVFTMTITDYGVPLMVGNTDSLTLPVMMYQDVVQGMDFGKGSVIGLVLLVPALIAFLIDLFNKDIGNTAFVLKPFSLKRGRLRDTLSYIICGVIGVMVLLPILTFGILTFMTKYPIDLTVTLSHIVRALNMNAGTYLGNSLVISLAVSVVGLLVSFVVAYLTTRLPLKASRFLHLISITTLAVPGLVLGLSYAMLFNGTMIYNTLAILIMVNLVHFFASPYLMLYNSFHKINENIEVVGATLGVSRFRIILDVLIPQSKATLVEMFTYFFVNSMMTISAVSFLATSATRPLALMIPSLEDTMMRESMAFVSLVILAVNLVIRIASNVYQKRIAAR